jgi:hypothetical protein
LAIRLLGSSLALGRERVLIGARDAESVDDVLGGHTHVTAFDSRT